MKHVVLYSGGAASSYVAYLVKKEVLEKGGNIGDIVLLHTPTLTELPDSEKFRLKVSQYLGIPMTTWGLGKDVWEIIEEEKMVPSNFMGFCTRRLKRECKESYYKYLEDIGETWIEYLGFTVGESGRVERAQRNATINRKLAGLPEREVRFPLYDLGMTSDDCKRIIRDEWNIPLPEAYTYLGHNNCIVCWKGGKNYFKAVWEHYPEYFFKAAEVEKNNPLQYTLFKGISLYELAEKWSLEKELREEQIGLFDNLQLEENIPCDCWND